MVLRGAEIRCQISCLSIFGFPVEEHPYGFHSDRLVLYPENKKHSWLDQILSMCTRRGGGPGGALL